MIQVTHYAITSGDWIPYTTTVCDLNELAILKSNLRQKHRKEVFLKHYTIPDRYLVKSDDLPSTSQIRVQSHLGVKRNLLFFDKLSEENKEKYYKLQKLIFVEKRLSSGHTLRELAEESQLSYNLVLSYYSYMLKSQSYKK